MYIIIIIIIITIIIRTRKFLMIVRLRGHGKNVNTVGCVLISKLALLGIGILCGTNPSLLEDYGNLTLLIQVEESAVAKITHMGVEARAAACFEGVLRVGTWNRRM